MDPRRSARRFEDRVSSFGAERWATGECSRRRAEVAIVARFFEEGMGPRLAEGVWEERKKYSWDRVSEAVEELAGPGVENA